ncbi:4-hydroxybenzoate octaprenyltransferase [Candidatus Hamiltonella defensa]|uniref:4-hydroxybenzoate octaprenyltransferase n=1 Tax=Candidatus Williamhamiltonella defendens TaxID=138072 RepID=A0AAC9VKS8_9ENTR|nr:4-hydroxybenzoate polyprenyltransferase [Candidatus Hamiltonella defensa]AWK17046.1 4-hydroxybenzoate polyprenyltransferase [Candidatus Hamiltonella defensa]MBK4361449.1 4-hydroxybenzoate octaprenyltransferase [Candidatus Hamiltonella defensa]
MHKKTWKAYCRLMRIDKPIGIFLLLWPTLWALWIASKGIPDIKILAIFILGVFFMRAAGCVINDYADRKIDGHVKRTASRPIPSGEVDLRFCKILFFVLIFLSFCLVLMLNHMTIAISLVAALLAWVYPFMKRVTHLPQLILGLAFGWSIPMAFSAVTQTLPIVCWLLLFLNLCWTLIYDTQYAMVDRNDDLRIGVKSTAILFGQHDRLIIGLLQFITVFLMILVGYLMQFGVLFYISVGLVGMLFIYQQKLMISSDGYFQAFMNNHYVGFILFLGIFSHYY